jgi:putative sterol carrier protein
MIQAVEKKLDSVQAMMPGKLKKKTCYRLLKYPGQPLSCVKFAKLKSD